MNDLYFCGDIHGKYETLVWNVVVRLGLHDADIIVLGDFGVGFTKDLQHLYKKTEPRLTKNNITIYALRGNHDDPSYFKNPESHSFDRLKFLEDHKVYSICDRSIYIIGGAYSTDANTNPECKDIVDRKIETAERLRKHKLPTYWDDENVVIKYTDLPVRVDIIASHTAPICFEPVSIRTSEISLQQYENIIKERKYLSYVLEEVRADYWFYGHYHRSYTGTYNNLLYRGLKELELFPSPQHKESNPQGKL